MTRQFSRRALLAGSAAVGGAYLASKVRDVGTLTSRLGNVRFQSFSREPIFLAMLDRHAQRLQPLIPEIERTLNRRLQIDALPADQLYANYTIDLLQQTGRYDVVSVNDHWTPYFGRRGYLSEVDSISDGSSGVIYPPVVETAATGVDGTPLVAYPWTFDFTCSAVRNELRDLVAGHTWSAMIGSMKQSDGIVAGFGLQASGAAAEVYRSVLLSFGEEVLRENDREPVLDHYWQARALDVVVRLAREAAGPAPVDSSLERVVNLAAGGQFNLLPVCWTSDSRNLVNSGAWTIRALPTGREGHRRSFVAVWMWGIPAGAPNTGKAREFVELMTSADIQAKLWPGASLIPATRSAIQGSDPAWLPVRPLAFDALDRGQLRPALRSYRSIMDIVGQTVAEAVSQQASTTSVLASANRRVREVLVREDELD